MYHFKLFWTADKVVFFSQEKKSKIIFKYDSLYTFTKLQDKFNNWIRILSGSRSLTLLLTYVYIEKCEKKILIDVFYTCFLKLEDKFNTCSQNGSWSVALLLTIAYIEELISWLLWCRYNESGSGTISISELKVIIVSCTYLMIKMIIFTTYKSVPDWKRACYTTVAVVLLSFLSILNN